MKKSLYILSFIIFVCSTYKSYSHWERHCLGTEAITSSMIYGNNIFVGTNATLFLSTDSCKKWDTINIMPEYNYLHVSSFASLNNNIFVGTAGNGLFLSSDMGINWKKVNNGLHDSNVNINSLAISDNNIFASDLFYGIFLSTDMGNNWVKVIEFPSGGVNTIFISDTNLYVSVGIDGVELSSDNGVTWQQLYLYHFVTSFAKMGNKIFAGGDRGVSYTTNIASNWTASSFWKNNYCVYSLCVDNNVIYAGTMNNGVYYSTDGGNNWDSLAVVGLTDQTILTMFKLGNYLYFGTNNKGLCRVALSDTVQTSVKETNTSPNNITISPNPASDVININGNINNYPIKIYSIEGIKQIEAENTKEIDISKLPQGVYYIQIGNYFTKFVKI